MRAFGLMPAGGETRSFHVPHGLDADGRLVARQDAVRGQSYMCPACGAPLVFRAGTRVSRHFAHRASAACDGETALHRTAKLLIKQVVEDALAGGSAIKLFFPCVECSEKFEVGFPLESVDGATLEARLPSGRVVDVLLVKGGAPRLAVEVFVSHRVDAAKASDLDFPWIEVTGADITTNPCLWTARAGKLRSQRCRKCREFEKLYQARCELALREARLECPPGYEALPVPCYRCNKVIPIFDWGAGGWATRAPPEPRPRTVQWRSSRVAGKSYWANTCPHCRAMQGDHHVRTARLYYNQELAEEVEQRLKSVGAPGTDRRGG